MTDEIESAEDFTDRIWFGLTNLKLQAEVAARDVTIARVEYERGVRAAREAVAKVAAGSCYPDDYCIGLDTIAALLPPQETTADD